MRSRIILPASLLIHVWAFSTAPHSSFYNITRGMKENCSDSDPELCAPGNFRCPLHNVQCCRSCMSFCNDVGGKKIDRSAFDAIECAIPRGPPANWSEPKEPFILELFNQAEADRLLNWSALEAHRGPVKVMTRPVCGSNFQEPGIEYAQTDFGDLASILREGDGEGPIAQLRLLRAKIDVTTLDEEFKRMWQSATTEAGPDIAASIYDRVLTNAAVTQAARKLGMVNENGQLTDDPQYSAIWMGSAGSRTPWHMDSWPSALLQVQGTKHVSIGRIKESDGPDAADEIFPVMSGGSRLQRVLEDSNKELPLSMCLLKPGEMLFVPAYWRHDIFSIDPTVSIGIRMEANERFWLKVINRRPDYSATLLYFAHHMSDWVPVGQIPASADSTPQVLNQQTKQYDTFEVRYADGLSIGPFRSGDWHDPAITTRYTALDGKVYVMSTVDSDDSDVKLEVINRRPVKLTLEFRQHDRYVAVGEAPAAADASQPQSIWMNTWVGREFRVVYADGVAVESIKAGALDDAFAGVATVKRIVQDKLCSVTTFDSGRLSGSLKTEL
eukprot:TRINITY_DN90663_c0_g1_i1.p1 TRINITY_DN90663_c0_g1~~TRINITY_DN90663_c0_g1_i1.p1  ORF type:complete len:573 (+),score=70.98 TRINITY_DN90663_c0_g1_i1:56-1720(+)